MELHVLEGKNAVVIDCIELREILPVSQDIGHRISSCLKMSLAHTF